MGDETKAASGKRLTVPRIVGAGLVVALLVMVAKALVMTWAMMMIPVMTLAMAVVAGHWSMDLWGHLGVLMVAVLAMTAVGSVGVLGLQAYFYTMWHRE